MSPTATVAAGGGGLGRLIRPVLLLAGACAVPLAGVRAQVEIDAHAIRLGIAAYVHAQLNTTTVEGEREADFLIRRARLALEVNVNDFVTGYIQPDFGKGEAALQDAYVRLNFNPAFRATMGQFKRPFDLFELTSSTQILVIERDGAVRGIDACGSVGGTCSFSRLSGELQYSTRDIGVMFDGAFGNGVRSDGNGLRGGVFRYMLAVTNGPGQNVEDENGSKSYSGRIEVTPVAGITVAGNVGVHDYLEPIAADLAENEYAFAFGGDVEVGNFDRGVHFQGGLITGDDWMTLVAGTPATFLAAQGILTYKLPVSPAACRPEANSRCFLSAVEPVARVSWADPDTDLADDEAILATGGLVLHLVGRNKLAANVDVWIPQVGDTEWSLKVQSYLHF